MIHLIKTDDAWSGLVVPHARPRDVSPWRSKVVGVVWRVWLHWDDRVFHGENGTSNDLVNKQPRESALVKHPRSYLKEER